jgi:hypothetical protein
MERLARRFGAETATALVRPFRKRGVEAIARENAVEGCVRELYGALVATWQAEHAVDPAVRATMRRVAIDETHHAFLSLEVGRFLEGHLDHAARARVRRAQQRAIGQLSRDVERALPTELLVQAGLPSTTDAQLLVRGLAATVWFEGHVANDTKPLTRTYARRVSNSRSAGA